MPDAAPSTPLLEQYEGVKARYPGHLVLFRVGDFYEVFGEDAKLLSEELDITLTARGADAQGVRTPMAGVPHHAVEGYLGRLVEKGYKVAVCDQVEDARLSKGLLRREVTRVVTPGTAVEERLLPGAEHNFLVSLELPAEGPARFAAVDVTTGEWYRGRAAMPGPDGALSALAPFEPREALLTVAGAPERFESLARALRHEYPRIRIEAATPASGPSAELPAGITGDGEEGGTVADRALGAFVAATQPRLLPYLELADPAERGRKLLLDGKTLRHLEIARPMDPDDPRGPTLLRLYDEAATAAGRRTVSFWLKSPLADLAPILARQEAVAFLAGRGAELLGWRRDLGHVADIARIAARVAGRRVRPAELRSLRESLVAAAVIADRLRGIPAPPGRLAVVADRIDPLTALARRLEGALPDADPGSPDEVGRFRPGHAPEVDAELAEETKGLAELAALERREQEASGIRTLRVGFNQVFGYYFEVTRPNLPRVPSHFRRKQTISGGERFTSEALEAIEGRVLAAREAAATAGAAAWERLLAEVEAATPGLYRLSRTLGELDALLTFAHLAVERGHVRPTVTATTALKLREARHPVLERTLSGRFVPNDTDLGEDAPRLLVLTGPNMAGKSTYMRQIGLIVVLAQAGAFVPAKFAEIGIVSSLYTRMGFTDEIGRGKSSFLVEMSEVAEILAGADERSLVLLDEVGRGTSTFDGLALAWATLRHLATVVRCRTVLATHYHQLTELVEALPGARNAHLAATESDGTIVLLHRLLPGSTDRSYGIHVARLAGLPAPLLSEAERLLKRLEVEGPRLADAPPKGRAPLRYTQALLVADAPAPSPLDAELKAIDPDRMTPLEALRWLTEARRRLGPGSGAR